VSTVSNGTNTVQVLVENQEEEQLYSLQIPFKSDIECTPGTQSLSLKLYQFDEIETDEITCLNRGSEEGGTLNTCPYLKKVNTTEARTEDDQTQTRLTCLRDDVFVFNQPV
jgi:hypothetical protein